MVSVKMKCFLFLVISYLLIENSNAASVSWEQNNCETNCQTSLSNGTLIFAQVVSIIITKEMLISFFEQTFLTPFDFT